MIINNFFFKNIIYGYYLFFFFQAEDGIRDQLVTGVQTCALPIYVFLAVPKPCLAGGSERGMALERPEMRGGEFFGRSGRDRDIAAIHQRVVAIEISGSGVRLQLVLVGQSLPLAPRRLQRTGSADGGPFIFREHSEKTFD